MNHVSARIEERKGERKRFGRREPLPKTEPDRDSETLGFTRSWGRSIDRTLTLYPSH